MNDGCGEMASILLLRSPKGKTPVSRWMFVIIGKTGHIEL